MIGGYLVLQEGGTSEELYMVMFDSEEEAIEYRASCAEGSYRTSPVIPVPKALLGHEVLLINLIDEVVTSTRSLEVYEGRAK